MTVKAPTEHAKAREEAERLSGCSPFFTTFASVLAFISQVARADEKLCFCKKYWFDASFLPTTFLKTKHCQSLLSNAHSLRGGGGGSPCFCLVSIVSWQLSDPHTESMPAPFHIPMPGALFSSELEFLVFMSSVALCLPPSPLFLS